MECTKSQRQNLHRTPCKWKRKVNVMWSIQLQHHVFVQDGAKASSTSQEMFSLTRQRGTFLWWMVSGKPSWRAGWCSTPPVSRHCHGTWHGPRLRHTQDVLPSTDPAAQAQPRPATNLRCWVFYGPRVAWWWNHDHPGAKPHSYLWLHHADQGLQQWPIGLLCSSLSFSLILFWRTMRTTRACWENIAVLPPSPGNRKKQEGAVIKYEPRQRQKSAVFFSESPGYGGHRQISVLTCGCSHCLSMNNNMVYHSCAGLIWNVLILVLLFLTLFLFIHHLLLLPLTLFPSIFDISLCIYFCINLWLTS